MTLANRLFHAVALRWLRTALVSSSSGCVVNSSTAQRQRETGPACTAITSPAGIMGLIFPSFPALLSLTTTRAAEVTETTQKIFVYEVESNNMTTVKHSPPATTSLVNLYEHNAPTVVSTTPHCHFVTVSCPDKSPPPPPPPPLPPSVLSWTTITTAAGMPLEACVTQQWGRRWRRPSRTNHLKAREKLGGTREKTCTIIKHT